MVNLSLSLCHNLHEEQKYKVLLVLQSHICMSAQDTLDLSIKLWAFVLLLQVQNHSRAITLEETYMQNIPAYTIIS